LGEIFRIR